MNVADSAAESQLVAGFYGLENKTWRWTAKKFVVTLQPPRGSDQKGGSLHLRLMIPDEEIKKLGPMTLSADVDDYTVPPETFTKGGSYSYVREVPGSVLAANLVPVIFTFDKSTGPTAADGRELAAVVTDISLQSK